MNWRAILMAGIFIVGGVVGMNALGDEVTLVGQSYSFTDEYNQAWLNTTDVQYVSNAETVYDAPPWNNVSSTNLTVVNESLRLKYFDAIIDSQIDSFEDGSLDGWDTSSATISTSQAFEGSNSVRLTENGYIESSLSLKAGKPYQAYVYPEDSEYFRYKLIDSETGNYISSGLSNSNDRFISGDKCSEITVSSGYVTNDWYQMNMTFNADGTERYYSDTFRHEYDVERDCTDAEPQDIDTIRIQTNDYQTGYVDLVSFSNVLREAGYAEKGELRTPTFTEQDNNRVLNIISHFINSSINEGELKVEVVGSNATDFNQNVTKVYVVDNISQGVELGKYDINTEYFYSNLIFNQTASGKLNSYNIEADYGTGVERNDGFYNTRENSEGGIEINNTDETTSEYLSDQVYNSGTGVYKSGIIQNSNPVNIDQLTVNADGIISGKTKATLYLNLYDGNTKVNTTEKTLENGLNTFNFEDASDLDVDGYSFDFLLETSNTRDNPEILDVTVEGTESERVFSGLAESLLYTLLFIVFVGLAMGVLAQRL